MRFISAFFTADDIIAHYEISLLACRVKMRLVLTSALLYAAAAPMIRGWLPLSMTWLI